MHLLFLCMTFDFRNLIDENFPKTNLLFLAHLSTQLMEIIPNRTNACPPCDGILPFPCKSVHLGPYSVSSLEIFATTNRHPTRSYYWYLFGTQKQVQVKYHDLRHLRTIRFRLRTNLHLNC